MEQVISSIKVITEGQGFIDITPSVREFIKEFLSYSLKYSFYISR